LNYYFKISGKSLQLGNNKMWCSPRINFGTSVINNMLYPGLVPVENLLWMSFSGEDGVRTLVKTWRKDWQFWRKLIISKYRSLLTTSESEYKSGKRTRESAIWPSGSPVVLTAACLVEKCLSCRQRDHREHIGFGKFGDLIAVQSPPS